MTEPLPTRPDPALYKGYPTDAAGLTDAERDAKHAASHRLPREDTGIAPLCERCGFSACQCGQRGDDAPIVSESDVASKSLPSASASDFYGRPASQWQPRHLRVGYPTSDHDWEPIASPACLIEGRHVLEHAQRYFEATGEHYLLVRFGDTSRPVLDDETMAELPLTEGVVAMRLVKLLV